MGDRIDVNDTDLDYNEDTSTYTDQDTGNVYDSNGDWMYNDYDE